MERRVGVGRTKTNIDEKRGRVGDREIERRINV